MEFLAGVRPAPGVPPNIGVEGGFLPLTPGDLGAPLDVMEARCLVKAALGDIAPALAAGGDTDPVAAFALGDTGPGLAGRLTVGVAIGLTFLSLADGDVGALPEVTEALVEDFVDCWPWVTLTFTNDEDEVDKDFLAAEAAAEG
eukprot:Trichotokara_eunicae@DN312_c0_g1_i1.p2